jgi:hypothetical protein
MLLRTECPLGIQRHQGLESGIMVQNRCWTCLVEQIHPSMGSESVDDVQSSLPDVAPVPAEIDYVPEDCRAFVALPIQKQCSVPAVVFKKLRHSV